MALRGTLTHRKTRRLAVRLKVDQCAALGYLEALWHVAGEQQVDGGIGRMSDQDIADEMFYSGDAAELIDAFISAGWIDRVPECRLYIHDWHEHADDSVRAKLSYRGKRFANGVPANPNFHKRIAGSTKQYRRRVAIRAAGGDVTGSMKRLVHKRDGSFCRHCGAVADLTIDHIRPVTKGGLTALENLQILCRPCNSSKRDQVIQ